MSTWLKIRRDGSHRRHQGEQETTQTFRFGPMVRARLLADLARISKLIYQLMLQIWAERKVCSLSCT